MRVRMGEVQKSVEKTLAENAKVKPDAGAVFYAVLAVVAACIAVYVRLRLAGMPLDRDEGEFAYAGRLALQGVPPYLMVFNMKLPGIYWIYALIMAVFGQTDWAIRAGFLIINLINAALVCSIGRRLMDGRAGLASAASFLVLMLSNGLHGVHAGAENALLLFALAGLRVTLIAADTGRLRWYALAGLLFGVSIAVRQHGIFFLAAGLAYAAYAGRAVGFKNALKQCGVIAAASAAPLAVMLAYIFAAGVFANFFFWVFTYGMKYVGKVDLISGAGLFYSFARGIFSYEFSILLYALAGIAVSMAVKKTRGTGALLLMFLAFSFAATAVGMYFRPHYFIYIMPAAALMCGAGAYFSENSGMKPAGKMIARVVLAAMIAVPVFIDSGFYFRLAPGEAIKAAYRDNPFDEMKKIAAYIKENSPDSDTIAVLGSEPQVYFYSNRRSATGYIYMYPLMEPHAYAGGMQERAISAIEASKPGFIVLVNCLFSWSVGPKSDRHIFQWFDGYNKGRYEIAGTADMVSPFETEYRWGKEITDRDYKKPYRITVFKRIER